MKRRHRRMPPAPPVVVPAPPWARLLVKFVPVIVGGGRIRPSRWRRRSQPPFWPVALLPLNCGGPQDGVVPVVVDDAPPKGWARRRRGCGAGGGIVGGVAEEPAVGHLHEPDPVVVVSRMDAAPSNVAVLPELVTRARSSTPKSLLSTISVRRRLAALGIVVDRPAVVGLVREELVAGHHQRPEPDVVDAPPNVAVAGIARAGLHRRRPAISRSPVFVGSMMKCPSGPGRRPWPRWPSRDRHRVGCPVPMFGGPLVAGVVVLAWPSIQSKSSGLTGLITSSPVRLIVAGLVAAWWGWSRSGWWRS